MYETLRMMKSILNGKEEKISEKELIKEYQENLSPNILAYFYVSNFGLILQISKKYPLLLNEDKASFCLQELDLSLKDYNFQNKFMTYFAKRFKNKLYKESQYYLTNKRKAIVNAMEFDNNINNKSFYDLSIEDFDLICSQYKLSELEKKHSKLKLMGYSIKEIAKICNLPKRNIYYTNEKIKNKILKLIVNLG